MSENEVKTEATQENESSIKDKLSSIFSNVITVSKSVFEDAKQTAIETSKTLKDKADDFKREKEADEIYRKLGKKIYKLASRDEISLPECCEKYVAELDALYADEVKADDAECQCCADCKCDSDCKCDAECKCEVKEEVVEAPKEAAGDTEVKA